MKATFTQSVSFHIKCEYSHFVLLCGRMEIIMLRYERNKAAISEREQEMLSRARVLVAGCGGLGGYCIELLGRIGTGHITAVDRDIFDETNLNRQLLSTVSTLGRPKAEAAAERMRDVNPMVSVKPRVMCIDMETAGDLVLGHDVVIDALDSLKTRRILLCSAQRAGIAYVHGAISGWRGRVTVAMPEDDRLCTLLEYADDGYRPPEGNLGFTAAMVASVQVSEAVKLILKTGRLSDSRILEFDLLGGTFDSVELG